MLITDYIEHPAIMGTCSCFATESGPAFPVVISSTPRNKCFPCSTLNVFLSVPMQMCENQQRSTQGRPTHDVPHRICCRNSAGRLPHQYILMVRMSQFSTLMATLLLCLPGPHPVKDHDSCHRGYEMPSPRRCILRPLIKETLRLCALLS
jgi:hypothetical protein